ncbi:hypothetical protein, partial [Enterococcus faecium]
MGAELVAELFPGDEYASFGCAVCAFGEPLVDVENKWRFRLLIKVSPRSKINWHSAVENLHHFMRDT